MPEVDVPDESLEVLKGTLELIVLTTLAAGEPMHGFGVLDWIRDATEDDLVVEEGALYPALHRMERRGWIAGEWAVSKKGRRAKYYRITDGGREALERERARWGRYTTAVAKVARAAGF
jgi:PadR family transcriptional regulator PadR